MLWNGENEVESSNGTRDGDPANTTGRHSRPIRTFLAKRSQSDLVILRELIESAEVTPIVDRTYGLDEVPEAIRCLEEGHARGKVAVKI